MTSWCLHPRPSLQLLSQLGGHQGPSWEFQEAHRVGRGWCPPDTPDEAQAPISAPGDVPGRGRFLGSLAPGAGSAWSPRFILTSVCSNKHKVFIFLTQ